MERANRFTVDNPHQQRETRTVSLNPRIYPDWWGEEDEINRIVKGPKGGAHPARKGDRNREDSLDQRIANAAEKPKQKKTKKGAQETYYHS
jgi:hypothetical protein